MSEINSYGKYNSCRCLEIPTGFSKYPVGKLFLLRYFFFYQISFMNGGYLNCQVGIKNQKFLYTI